MRKLLIPLLAALALVAGPLGSAPASAGVLGCREPRVGLRICFAENTARTGSGGFVSTRGVASIRDVVGSGKNWSVTVTRAELHFAPCGTTDWRVIGEHRQPGPPYDFNAGFYSLPTPYTSRRGRYFVRAGFAAVDASFDEIYQSVLRSSTWSSC